MAASSHHNDRSTSTSRDLCTTPSIITSPTTVFSHFRDSYGSTSTTSYDISTPSITAPPRYKDASTSTSHDSSSASCCHSGPTVRGSRNIVVCIDGTSNRFGQNTNVVELFAKIDLESTYPEQTAYYVSGVGTRPKPLHVLKNRKKRSLSDKIDMVIGWNVERLVIDAYAWLARTYRRGDQIYLFGFSRGAYQARLLAAMIYEVGLIKAATDEQIGTAYDHYDTVRSKEPNAMHDAKEFRDTFSWTDLKRVHFVGVWDTVSSVGLIKKDVFLSYSSSSMHACHFRHALALDERRVKFMPEYFHEINPLLYHGSMFKDNTGKPERNSKLSVKYQYPSLARNEGDGRKGTIKEVWFAGCHSDVGGTKKLGQPYRAGNVSLLWMRREAVDQGLKLYPTDVVWVPDDLDFGTSDSMNWFYRALEYFPIRHQTGFSGMGRNTRGLHRQQPRRIIPGQKVHASILYANTYTPQATLGEGFDIPIIDAESEDADLNGDVWEKGLFDPSVAGELLNHLRNPGVASVYLDRLLFMLRFEEGRKCFKETREWKALIGDGKSLVRLVALVAYYEIAGDSANDPSEDVFVNATKCLDDILAKPKHQDGPRVVSLLKLMTKHKILLQRMLTDEIFGRLKNLLNEILASPQGNFAPAMDCLNCLLRCDATRDKIIKTLRDNSSDNRQGGSLLSRILQAKEPKHLTPALRMTLTLVQKQKMSLAAAVKQVPLERQGFFARHRWSRKVAAPARDTPGDAEAKEIVKFWSEVKPKVRELAECYDGHVGRLAVKILFALYVEGDRRLDLLNSRVGDNVASALISLKAGKGHTPGGQVDNGHSEQQVFHQLIGLVNGEKLDPMHEKFITALTKAVKNGNARERTAGTLTFLGLFDHEGAREHMRVKGLLKIFINQLQHRSTALLAARALDACLGYDDMKKSLVDDKLLNKLADNIVRMLLLDYFDDAVGEEHGFQIFSRLMQHSDLRKKVESYDISQLLKLKLMRGKSAETRTSLIYLDIFLEHHPEGLWASDLISESLTCLEKRTWKSQKVGVLILSALAHTKRGVEAVKAAQAVQAVKDAKKPIFTMIELLLQKGCKTKKNGAQPPSGQPLASGGTPSEMMGLACALRILAQNETLRQCIHDTRGYNNLKDLHLTDSLVSGEDTSVWYTKTPNRSDVTDMLEKMIKTIDGELSEEGLMLLGDAALPHITHWDLLGARIGRTTVGMITVLPVALGLTILAVPAVPTIYFLRQVFGRAERSLRRSRNSRVLDRLRPEPENDDPAGKAAPGN